MTRKAKAIWSRKRYIRNRTAHVRQVNECRRKRAAKRRIEEEVIAGRPRPTCCEICGDDSRKIVFDHCHNTGHFRGFICDQCNRILGLVKDSPRLLEKMAKYLQEGQNVKSYYYKPDKIKRAA